MILIALTTSALFIQASPASAPSPAASPSVATLVVPGGQAAKPREAPTRLVCRDEPVLGTLFPKRVCATQAELADRRRADQDNTRKMQNPFEVIPPDATR